MKSAISLSVWFLLLMALTPNLQAQDEDLFGEEPAKKEAPQAPVPNADDDLFGEPAPPKSAEPAPKPAADAAEDDLFSEPAPADKPTPPQDIAPPVAAKTPLRSKLEVSTALTKENDVIAKQFVEFIELSKELAKRAVESGNKDELMPILREYGPAVIRTKQLWRGVVGNPAKYETWLGREEYRQAWDRFHESWQSLYGFTDRFAAVDLDLADKLSDAMNGLSQSLDDYSDLADEWDGTMGNNVYLFARGNSRLNVISRQQFRDEAAADRETKQIAEDQLFQEEDADRQTKQAAADIEKEEADDDGEDLFSDAPPTQKDIEEMKEVETTNDEKPEEDNDLFGDP